MSDADSKPIYEGSPKHRQPWQPGRRGSLCTKVDEAGAAELLANSELVGKKRYATDGARAFCGEEHRPGVWHGWPVGYKEIEPESIWHDWIDQGVIKRKDKKRYWHSSEVA